MHRVVAQKMHQQRDRFNFRDLANKASPMADPKSDGCSAQPRIETTACLRDEDFLARWPHKTSRVESFGVLPRARVIVCMSNETTVVLLEWTEYSRIAGGSTKTAVPFFTINSRCADRTVGSLPLARE